MMIRSPFSLLQQVKKEQGICNDVLLDECYSHKVRNKTMIKKSNFRKFVEKKRLEDRSFHVLDQEGKRYNMTVQEVLEHIDKATIEEQRLIERQFRSIDDRNGDLLHYIRFLGQAIFNQTNR